MSKILSSNFKQNRSENNYIDNFYVTQSSKIRPVTSMVQLQKNIMSQSQLDKSIKEKMKPLFQCKCHWTPEKEEIYKEHEQLKDKYNELHKEKTKIQQQLSKLDKDFKLQQKLIEDKRLVVVNNKLQKTASLSTKKQLEDYQIELDQKNHFIQKLLKDRRLTNYQELQIENQAFYAEIQRIKKMLDFQIQENFVLKQELDQIYSNENQSLTIKDHHLSQEQMHQKFMHNRMELHQRSKKFPYSSSFKKQSYIQNL